ncbi:MFS transporter [Paenibacillus sp. 453mf]|uniref:staphylopine family metallophore export MFS transporter CntE n=1 Tax=Paenibacillus sp. 453mf TaxID=1761874 RepID=UPI0008EE6EB6|nr:MFS transporter [Paenibacillus sp. 453mf]SFS53031.1 Predicted arabinose efflux permease, MFS family [Paenibacillus sp. 453mf]
MKGALSWPFLRLYILVLLYFSANAILNVIIPLQGDELGASNTTIGLVMGAYLFTTMLFRPWAGSMIARFGPIKILRVILVTNGIALILYAVTDFNGYVVARILQGISTAFFSMALQIGIIDSLPEKERSQGISLYSLFSYIPGIVGPLFALMLWQTGDSRYFGAVMISIAILTAVVGYTARMTQQDTATATAKPQVKEPGARMLGSFHHLFTNPHLFKCSVLMLVASVVFGSFATFIPLYSAQITYGNAAVFLMIQAATVVVSRLVLRKKIPSDGKWHPMFVAGTLLLLTLAALFVSLSATTGPVLFYISALFIGIAQAILYPTLTTYLTFVLPEAHRNMLIGLFIATADLGVSLGGVLMGPVVDMSSYSLMYLICAVLGAGLIVIASTRRLRTA